MGSKVEIKPGVRFGKLTVVSESPRRNAAGHVFYICKCECGAFKEVRGTNLRGGVTKSCGCSSAEMLRKESRLADDPIYQVFESMKSRCFCKTDKSYHNYGERGIGVSPEWANDFQAFRDWCVENGYRRGLWLDRIDNNVDYSPENCRWTTPKVQQRNKRVNVYAEINGVRKCVADWADENGIKPRTVYSRWKRGWRGADLIKPTDLSRSHPEEIKKALQKKENARTEVYITFVQDEEDMPRVIGTSPTEHLVRCGERRDNGET